MVSVSHTIHPMKEKDWVQRRITSLKAQCHSSCMLTIHPKCPSLTPFTPQPLHLFLSSSLLCVFKAEPHFHACWLAEGCWWIGKGQLSLSVSFFSLFPSYLNPIQTNRPTGWQTQEPAVPVTPVTFLISSELFSMPPVKRFSVSFARHPTNGMSAFIQVYSTLLRFFLLSCMTFCWENISCVYSLGVLKFDCVNYIKHHQD